VFGFVYFAVLAFSNFYHEMVFIDHFTHFIFFEIL
jgi:hypothetical protein